ICVSHKLCACTPIQLSQNHSTSRQKYNGLHHDSCMKIAKRVLCNGEIHCHPLDSRLRFFVLTYHTIVSKHLRKLYLRDLTQHLTWLSIPTMGNSCHNRPDGHCSR